MHTTERITSTRELEDLIKARYPILYLMLLGFVIVSSVFFPATRLRAPVEFVLMFFSACALARWTRRA